MCEVILIDMQGVHLPKRGLHDCDDRYWGGVSESRHYMGWQRDDLFACGDVYLHSV